MENQNKSAGKGLAGAAPFVLGLVVALTFGWWVFPGLLFSQKPQPVKFNHATHIDTAGMSCSDCHFVRADGTFSGIPKTEDCASCHSAAQGESQEEADYIANYVEPGKEVDWLVHVKQPDNVFFSHSVHSAQTCMRCHVNWRKTPEKLCTQCHLSYEERDKFPPFEENRLTGYGKSIIKMAQCESCHANPHHMGVSTTANNACFTCHK